EEMNYYRLPTFIQFIQSHLIFLEKYETIPPKEIFNYYNSRSYEIKSRELWLIKEEVDPTVDELGEIKAMYPYDVVFVTQEQLQKAIEKQYLDIVYMHKVGLGANKKGDYVVKFIFTADGELYYYDQYFVEPVKSPEGFSEKDIRRIDR
ncbi:MAG: hypothetical protein KKA07_13525, partial [Bacteroidetes bacterium]|nr:hypothetical protein [Bacteroidota bacterium]